MLSELDLIYGRCVSTCSVTNPTGDLEGAVRRGRGGKEKEWADCVQSDIRAFGITGDWKAMALKVEV